MALAPSIVRTQVEGYLPPKPPRSYQMLPHVSIGDVTGLIERVNARGGREDLYQFDNNIM